MKQTPVCVLSDWPISNSTSKDDVERWMSKDSRYARSTERRYNYVVHILFNVVLTFKSVGEILTCDHSNESY